MRFKALSNHPVETIPKVPLSGFFDDFGKSAKNQSAQLLQLSLRGACVSINK